jgi:hypothetical protein
MNGRVSAFLTAGLLACGVAAADQSATTTTDKKWDSKEITVSGCVEKTKSGGYFLMASSEMGAPATTTGTSGTTTAGTTAGAATAGTTATTGATESKSGRASTTWNLGQSDKLERYVGQRVQVVGRPEHDTSGDQLKGTHSGGEIKARDIDVKSVTVLAPSCR